MRKLLGLSCTLSFTVAMGGCFGLNIEPGEGGESSSTGGEARALVSGGSSFGECAGACRFELSFGQQSAQLVVEDWSGGAPLGVNTGDYTTAGLALVDGVEESLTMATLNDIYGCPDCDDGGASWVQLFQADLSTVHRYEFSNPPAELEQYDQLLQSMVSALRSCQANDHITPTTDCTPIP